VAGSTFFSDRIYRIDWIKNKVQSSGFSGSKLKAETRHAKGGHGSKQKIKNTEFRSQEPEDKKLSQKYLTRLTG
jgi:hypothetical protein